MVLLYRSVCLLVSGWYRVFVRCFRPSNVHNVSKHSLTTCGPLSVSRKPWILYGMTQWLKIIYATRGAVVFYDGIGQLSFVYRSGIMTINWFPVVVFCSGPRMSMATNSKCLLAESSFRWRFLLRPTWFIVHSRQLPTFV